MKYLVIIFLIIIFIDRNNLIGQSTQFPEFAMGAKSYSLGRSASCSFIETLGIINNPATISEANGITASIYYTKLLLDAINYSGGIIIPVKEVGNFGISFYQYRIDGLIQTHSDVAIFSGTFSYVNSLTSLSYGKQINENLSFGVNAKFMRSEITDNYIDDLLAFDLGVNYWPQFEANQFSQMKFGLSLKNLLSTPVDDVFQAREIILITENTFRFSKLQILALMNYRFYEFVDFNWKQKFNMGINFQYEMLNASLGYESTDFYSMGAGIRVKSLVFQYAYGINEFFDNNHALSLEYYF